MHGIGGVSPPSPILCKAAKEPLLPQEAGRVPVTAKLKSVSVMRAGKASGLPQLSGNVPAHVSLHPYYDAYCLAWLIAKPHT